MKMNKGITKILSVVLSLIMIVTGLPLVGIDLFDKTMAKTISEYEVGDIIEFGSYPQSEVTGSTILSTLNSLGLSWTSYGYYSGTGDDDNGQMTSGDYMMYADVTYMGDEYRAVKFTKYRPYLTGYKSAQTYAYQEYNGYYTNTVYWFKYEPLQWRVLDPDEGFMMCESIIDSQPYNNTLYYNGNKPSGCKHYQDVSCTIYANNYATSSIRDWLNYDFYNTAFTSAEKVKILHSTQDNSCYDSSYPQFDSDTTYDKIFILSYDEVINSDYGFSSSASKNDAKRRTKGTDYAKAQGLEVCRESGCYGYSSWWFRTPSYLSVYACGTYFDGGATADLNNISLTRRGVRPALKINPNVSLEKINEQYPDGYDYEKDSYNFSNSSVADTVSVDIYKDVFGDQKGQIVYDVKEKGRDSHGLCYGMAATTGSLLLDIPYVDSFLKLTGPCETISDINRGTKSIELDMITAKTFIKYGYVTQYSTHAERIWDCESLYNAVWDYVNNGGAPIIVAMLSGDEYNEDESKYEQTVGHAVLAIGIEGNDTIIVDDSNSPDEERKITLTRNSDGEFTGEWKCNDYSWSYGNNNAEGTPSHVGIIGYTKQILLPSMVKMYHAELDTNITYAEEDESSDAICDFEEIDTEYNLLYTSSDEINIACDSDKLMKIDDPITGGSIFSDSSSLYWIDKDKDISLENTSDEDVQVKFTDNYSGIATTLTTGSKINALADDSTDNYVDIDCVDGQNVDVTFSVVDCTGEKVEIVVSATANDENISASLTDNGISISGVSDGDVSVVKYDEIVETKTITETEIELETELPNAGHNFVNGVCIDCGERTIQLEEMSSQIRFNRNEDGSYAETFDVRTRAMISDKDFTELVGPTNAEAVKNIDKVGFVYTVNGESFSAKTAQAVAQGEQIAGYVDKPVSYIQDADGYYMFTCLVKGIPETDKNYTLTAYAYICVNGKWYFSEAPMNADFNSLYETYYPVACEKYGW